MNKVIGILGYGEIGKAVGKFYKKFFVKELDSNSFPDKIDVLNVCIPFLKNFVGIVDENIKKYSPEIVIIHSTISIGTTMELQLRHRDKIIVHSPVRGIHPHLEKGIKEFVKYIGAENEKDGKIVAKHFKSIGIKKSKVVIPSKNSEALKLWSTTQYFLNIILEKEIYKFCKDYKLDFDIVYKDANESYNKGYEKLKCPQYKKYVLDQRNGKCGGHCLVPNAEILQDKISKFCLELNKNYE